MKVVFVHEQDNNSSMWRCVVPMRALRAAGHEALETNIYRPDPQVFLGADVVVVQRPTLAEHVGLIRELKGRGIPVLVEVDDLFGKDVLHPSNPAFPIFDPKTARRLGWPTDRLSRLFQGIREADALVVTTEYLADAYRHLNPSVFVVPNFYDDTNPLWDRVYPHRPSAPDRVVVQFTGSAGHGPDLRVIRPVLLRLLEARPQVEVRVGSNPEFLRVLAPVPARLVGGVPYDRYPLLLSQADIILAPLDLSLRFNLAKSDIRVVEAGLVGVPWVGSAAPVYEAWGAGGIVARTSAQWLDALVALVDDPGLRDRLGAEGRAKALGRGITRGVSRWLEVFDAVRRSAPCPC